ncbi:MAG TPA: protein kinase, partial [Acetobacteraceae bacterium]
MSSTLSHVGKYELRSVVARTASSIVYDGWDADIDRRVAIKIIPLPTIQDDEAREALVRFRRGAKAAGKLAHPNIVGVYDYGETDGYAYIVMEFIQGSTLKQVLDSRETFDIPLVQKVMGEILDGLQYSHDHGIVHRDMKPANIMFTRNQRTKITDFGIARIEDSNLTQAGTVIGTPAYMSPEQFIGEDVDWRTDIYSSGVILYNMVTGARPYHGTFTTIMNKVLNTPVPKPSAVLPSISPALDEIVARAMAKKREHRFQSAAAFNAALQSIQPAFKAPVRPPSPLRVEVADSFRSALRPRSRRSAWLAGGVVAALAAIGAAAGIYRHMAAGPVTAMHRTPVNDGARLASTLPDAVKPVIAPAPASPPELRTPQPEQTLPAPIEQADAARPSPNSPVDN